MGVAREAKKEEKAAHGDELRDGGPQQDGGDSGCRRFENVLEDSRGAGGDFVGLVGSGDGDWRAVR